MKLYFARHGQSIGNLNRVHQNADTPLSELGISQAKELAKRFKSIPLDLILTSHFERAKNTAEIVAKQTKVKLEITELLREIKRPSEIEGKTTSDNIVFSIKEQIKSNLHDPTWHYSDEENTYDLINRAHEFIQTLNQRSETNILAISHSNFIGAVMGVIILGDQLTPQLFKYMEDNIWLHNTGITVLDNSENRWHLVTWNDNAHLGNL